MSATTSMRLTDCSRLALENSTLEGAFWASGRQPLPWDYFRFARHSGGMESTRVGKRKDCDVVM